MLLLFARSEVEYNRQSKISLLTNTSSWIADSIKAELGIGAPASSSGAFGGGGFGGGGGGGGQKAYTGSAGGVNIFTESIGTDGANYGVGFGGGDLRRAREAGYSDASIAKFLKESYRGKVQSRPALD